MTTYKSSHVVSSVLAVLVVSLVALSVHAARAQSDPFLGTWVLNVAKSKYTPGPPPKNQTSIYGAVGQGVRVTAKGTGADGKPTSIQFTANYDGKDYTLTGNPDWDATTLKRVDTHTVEFTRKRSGKVVQTGTNVVAKDGMSRTTTTKDVNAQGQQINNIAVYDKK